MYSICLFDFISTKSNTVCTALCVGIISKTAFLTSAVCVCVFYVIVRKNS